MRLPDKIYLNKYMIRPGMLYPAQYPADTPEFEYLSKDALLEWAREKEESLGKMFDVVPSMVLGAELKACKEFINKIQSL